MESLQGRVVAGVWMQKPVDGSQLSCVQGLPSSGHETGVATHTPFTHRSVVHARKSVQGLSSSFTDTHWPLSRLHWVSVQGLESAGQTTEE